MKKLASERSDFYAGDEAPSGAMEGGGWKQKETVGEKKTGF